MDERVEVGAEHSDVFQCFVHRQQGQEVGRDGAHPVLGGPHLGPSLISVKDRFFEQHLLEVLAEGTQAGCCVKLNGAQPASGDLHPEQVADQLRAALIGHVLTVEEVQRECSYFGTETHQLFGRRGRRHQGRGPAGALAAVGHMVGDHRLHLGRSISWRTTLPVHGGAGRVRPAVLAADGADAPRSPRGLGASEVLAGRSGLLARWGFGCFGLRPSLRSGLRELIGSDDGGVDDVDESFDVSVLNRDTLSARAAISERSCSLAVVKCSFSASSNSTWAKALRSCWRSGTSVTHQFCHSPRALWWFLTRCNAGGN